MQQKNGLGRSKLFVIMLMLTLSSVTSHGLILFNGSDIAFKENGKKNSSSTQLFVIEGASYFLKAYSGILAFQEKYELSELQGIDYSELQVLIGDAAENMEQAKLAYLQLIRQTDQAEYDQAILDCLRKFDYAAFEKQSVLGGQKFENVRLTLERGDIKGLYAQQSQAVNRILALLHHIKADVDANRFPATALLWKLNQLCAGVQLSGQYAAEIFLTFSEKSN